MARRVFISFQHADRQKASGFNLLKWNKNVEYDCTGRHLLSPVNSENEKYIGEQIRERLNGTSVTVVLIGRQTADSDWVQKEIEWSLEKGNGLVGVLLEPGAKVPEALIDCGAEVLPWAPQEIQDGIERAAEAAKRAASIRTDGSTLGGGHCAR